MGLVFGVKFAEELGEILDYIDEILFLSKAGRVVLGPDGF